jgi:hypothetical protein
MWFRKKEVKKLVIDDEVIHVLTAMSKMTVGSEEYLHATDNLTALYAITTAKSKPSFSMDTVIVAVTNILGIVVILEYEQLRVISSKAISFVLKGRV